MSERLITHYKDLVNKINQTYKSEYMSLEKACKLNNTKIRKYYTMCNTLGLESIANCPQKSSVKYLPQLDDTIHKPIPLEQLGGFKTTDRKRSVKKLSKIEQDVEFFDSELLKSDILNSEKQTDNIKKNPSINGLRILTINDFNLHEDE